MFSRPAKNENSLERVCRLDLTSFSAPQAPQRGSQGWNKISPIAFSFFTTPLHNTTTTNTGSLLMLKNISNRFRLLDSVFFLPHKIYDISQNKSAKKKLLSIHFQVLSLQEDQQRPSKIMSFQKVHLWGNKGYLELILGSLFLILLNPYFPTIILLNMIPPFFWNLKALLGGGIPRDCLRPSLPLGPTVVTGQ